jgi:hypothetical protein
MKGAIMKKRLAVSLSVVFIVMAVVVFYNKQRQYGRLKAQYDVISANYKRLLCEKYEPPSFNKTVSDEKKREIADLFKKIAYAYDNEQIDLMREYISIMSTDYCALPFEDRNQVDAPFEFKKRILWSDKLRTFSDVEAFERFARINIEAALFEGEMGTLLRRDFGAYVEGTVLVRLIQYKKKFANEGLTELEASAEKFISYWTSFIESDNGFTKRFVNLIVDQNELVRFIKPEESQTREEALRSARSFAQGIVRCGYKPKWLKDFEPK